MRAPPPSSIHGFDRLSDQVDLVNFYRYQNPEIPLPGAVPGGGAQKGSSSSCSLIQSPTDVSSVKTKDAASFRRYERAARSVEQLYAAQHERQTVEYNIRARKTYLSSSSPSTAPNARMTIWEALEKLDTLVDESDPDTDLSQLAHLLQTAEAIRADGHPDWMQLVGLLHDLGKLLCFFGAEQWSVVGDTYIVGCQVDPQTIIYPDSLALCPDYKHPVYSTQYGMYEPGCGLENVMFTWGHDEYMYEILKRSTTIPKLGLDMVRFHSAYPWHSRGAYRHLMAPQDYESLHAVLQFNAYDLYSKSDAPPNVEALRPYYESLIDKYVVGGKETIIEW